MRNYSGSISGSISGPGPGWRCSGERFVPAVFQQIKETLDDGTEGKASDDDIQTGLMMHFAVTYCNDDQMKFHFFLKKLISSETPRTIIKAIINTIESEEIEEVADERMLAEFYSVLKEAFELTYDSYLLATASASFLDLPYFLHSRDGWDGCLNVSNPVCNDLKSLGKCLTIL